MNETLFKPAWWLPGPHLQTLWPTLFRKRINKLPLTRERFELPDGDFLDLDWVGTSGPIVIMLHGLEGSIESPYAKGMLKAIWESGWRGLFMHFRGCSGEPNRLPRSYHSGDTSDLDFLVQDLRKREPNMPLAAIGFSLGGNVLLKWLGETGHNNNLTAAVAVSVPFEINKVVKRFQEGFSRLYQWHLLSCLKRRLQKKFQYAPANIPMPELSTLKTMKDFDEKITAPLHGFAGVEEYYSKASSRQYLSNIQVPTLLVQALDDPFMTQDAIPQTNELSSRVKLEVTPSGGHMGFVAGNAPWSTEYWLEQRIPAFLQAYL